MAVVEAPREIEAWLNSRGAKWEMETLPLSSIDEEESHRNQARISEPIIEDVVLRYAAAVEEGDQFPPIVVYEKGGKYIVMDGNHRVAAYGLGSKDEIQAYVVTNPNDNLIRVITYGANSKHGLPTNTDDRVLQAVYLVEAGMSRKQAAIELSVPRNRVEQIVKRREVERRLASMNVRGWERLPAVTRERFHAIKNDRPLAEMASLSLAAGLDPNEVSALVAQMNAIRSEKGQIEFVATERKERAAEIEQLAGGVMKMPKDVRLILNAAGMLSKVNAETLANGSLADSYKDRIMERLDDSIAYIKDIKDAL